MNSSSIIVLAYIDPGSGAMLLQWMIAFVVGAGLYFRRMISRLFKKIFRIGGRDKNPVESENKEKNKYE